ncbi:MAG: methyltransferase family protein [Candidatus Thorarchaeota archaeon]
MDIVQIELTRVSIPDIYHWEDKYLRFSCKNSMVDFSIAGPIIGVLAVFDVVLHIYLDMKKARLRGNSRFREPSIPIPPIAMTAVVASTLLSFFLVLIIPIVWVFGIEYTELSYLGPIMFMPDILWIPGFCLLIVGILLHGWSRYVRQEMAAAWAMSELHKLVTSGPYSRVRHPSYTSYLLSFIGLSLLLPSIVTFITLIGIWGYYEISKVEERHLIEHFGENYIEYMKRTGRFLPKL